MARVNLQVVMLVALAAVVVYSSPATGAGGGCEDLDSRPSLNRKGSNGVLCIPDVVPLLDVHEGHKKCVYNHPNGYRAVGAGYNLDDNVGQRREELSNVRADYDDVYSGKSCLDNLQITALVILDAKRALEGAAENVRRLDDFCCSLQAVFADIQHSAGYSQNFPRTDLEMFIEKAAKEDYTSAAHELGKTKWCSSQENLRRCDDNVDLVARGCKRTKLQARKSVDLRGVHSA